MSLKDYIKSIGIGLITLSCLFFVSCTEVDYTEIDQPAYLRVFNNLNYEVKLANRLEKPPFLTMLIDPVFNAEGIPVSAAIVGDFLDSRDKYAAPFPTHSAGSTSKKNPEYPGKENVLVGPILNGFDLSSWAQVPSGEHRIVFMYRPINEIPFFALEPKLKKEIAVDEVINLKVHEVYTLHVLQKNFVTKENGIILREENFQKLPLSDSLVYVNFYNMSAKGFVDSDDKSKEENRDYNTLSYGIEDVMDVYLSLYSKRIDNGYPEYDKKNAIPGFYAQYLTTVIRDTENKEVHPYASFPLFAGFVNDKIKTEMVQIIGLTAPALQYLEPAIGGNSNPPKQSANLSFYADGRTAIGNIRTATFPNMIINTHSGIYNPRSFASVNTIEIVNGRAYLTTIQRKYPLPIY